jgi:hypothetical protein
MALSLMLLAGLADCGPASSANVPSLGPNASLDEPSLPTQAPSLRTDAFTSVANPVSLASLNGGQAPCQEHEQPQEGTVLRGTCSIV